ncbi:armadillo repeat-containing protein 5 [Orussus abietinus]|uniref:armadillo repeat-containing protein 5 n=1 Tax=Orussus abietinus TaxID=222816 RepID=UPI0006264108|nr:armadillo repeat-containing protein 5 [Orussus abietinus]
MSSAIEKSECPIVAELSKNGELNLEGDFASRLTRIKRNKKSCEKFINGGGLPLLIELLHYPNKEILNVVLSVLADACVSADTRQRVHGTKIVAYTLTILKNVKLGDILCCRACRLVGNLASCKWHAKSLCEAGAVKVLANLLKLKCTSQTYLTAIRALRKIWCILESSREEILETRAIAIITNVFVTSKAAAAEESKRNELSEVCMKAMCTFVVNLDPRYRDQMRAETNVEGYKRIVEYCALRNKVAIKCLHSLCQVAECRPGLGNSGAIECVVGLIKENPLGSWELLDSLCLFCREAINRAKVRLNEGIETMLSILKNYDNKKYHSALLSALAQFLYDNQSISIMVKNGLLDVLVSNLKTMAVEVAANTKAELGTKKRSNDSLSCGNANSKYSRSNSGRFSLDYHPDYWLPSSPPLSSDGTTKTDESTKGKYSPVCTDTDWIANEEDSQEVASLESMTSVTAEVKEDEDEPSERVSRSGVNEYVNGLSLALLCRLTYSDEPIEQFAKPATIAPLTAYIKSTKNPMAVRILGGIVRNQAYLVSLITQGFVFDAETLHGSEQYIFEMCKLAETGGAVGELATLLIRGQESQKFVTAISIPFLIKSRDILRTLLGTHGGLALIFRVLNDRKHPLYEKAIWSINRLAHTLDIKPESVGKCQMMEETGNMADRGTNFPGDLPIPSTVTFVLDDGTTVDACRKILCQTSEPFFAMLEGNFFESGKPRIRLKNASREGLHTLLLAANGSNFHHCAIESLLDAVLIADQYLMNEVLETLTEISISSLNHENYSRAWNWARNNSCPEFRSCCIKNFLTAKMTDDERVQAFCNFTYTETFDEFLEDLRKMINGALCQR